MIPAFKIAVQEEISLLRKLVALRRTAAAEAFKAAQISRVALRRNPVPMAPASSGRGSVRGAARAAARN